MERCCVLLSHWQSTESTRLDGVHQVRCRWISSTCRLPSRLSLGTWRRKVREIRTNATNRQSRYLQQANRPGAWSAVRRTRPLRPKKWKKRFERYGQKTNKNKNIYIKGAMLWAADVCSRAAFAQPGPVSSISLGRFFSVRVSETVPPPSASLAPFVPALGPSPRPWNRLRTRGINISSIWVKRS